jgi:hypothetical protein
VENLFDLHGIKARTFGLKLLYLTSKVPVIVAYTPVRWALKELMKDNDRKSILAAYKLGAMFSYPKGLKDIDSKIRKDWQQSRKALEKGDYHE